MSYDVYVNLRYDEDALRRIVDLAPTVDFFGDGETAIFPPTALAAHNDRYRSTPSISISLTGAAEPRTRTGFS